MPAYHIVGLDLGKQADYSALALLRWEQPVPEPPPKRPAWWTPPVQLVSMAPLAGWRHYEVPTLQRWPLGTAYLDIAADVTAFLKRLGSALLVVDATGVGLPVCEMLRRRMDDGRVGGAMASVFITGAAP